ncbi:MAG: ABC transporter permease subunit, partial [Allorhizobium sp.]
MFSENSFPFVMQAISTWSDTSRLWLAHNLPWLFDPDGKIALGRQSKAFVAWLTTNGEWFFDRLAFIISQIIKAMLYVLQAPPPLVVILAITAIAYLLRRSVAIAVFTAAGLLLIVNQGYFKETTETLALVLASTAVSMLFGVPLGIAAARRPWVYSAMRPVLDLMQTIPTFVYLIPALILFGLGMVPGLIATVIFAIPAPIRLTRLGIISTPPALVEAAVAFGATPMQVLRKVELPFAMPQIMAGLTQTIMLSL